jgi:hypothetical protein
MVGANERPVSTKIDSNSILMKMKFDGSLSRKTKISNSNYNNNFESVTKMSNVKASIIKKKKDD